MTDEEEAKLKEFLSRLGDLTRDVKDLMETIDRLILALDKLDKILKEANHG